MTTNLRQYKGDLFLEKSTLVSLRKYEMVTLRLFLKGADVLKKSVLFED